MLAPDANIKGWWILLIKMAKTVLNILELSLTHFVPSIRHQYQCYRLFSLNTLSLNKALYICLFGESLLNDGIAVVLYRVFLSFLQMGPENILFADICVAFAKFLVVAGGGVILGVIYGFLGAFITKYTVNARIIEPTFVFTICFMAYLTAECFGLSAILAIVFCAFTMNSYVEHNISVKSHTTVKYGMKMISHICETLIFMCLGWAAISDFWKSWDTGFVLWKVQQLIFHFTFISPHSGSEF